MVAKVGVKVVRCLERPALKLSVVGFGNRWRRTSDGAPVEDLRSHARRWWTWTKCAVCAWGAKSATRTEWRSSATENRSRWRSGSWLASRWRYRFQLLTLRAHSLLVRDFQVLEDDGLPTTICKPCHYQLEKYYIFRKKCKSSDLKLRMHLKRLADSGIKSEEEKVDSSPLDELNEQELVGASVTIAIVSPLWRITVFATLSSPPCFFVYSPKTERAKWNWTKS